MFCATCRYAKRDKKGRYADRCDGYGNCAYEEYEGPTDLYLYEKIAVLRKEIATSDCFEAYFKEGAKYAMEKMIEILRDEEIIWGDI